jgi:hypothetical protein
MENPDVIAPIDGNGRDGPHDPVIRELRPGWVDLKYRHAPARALRKRRALPPAEGGDDDDTN